MGLVAEFVEGLGEGRRVGLDASGLFGVIGQDVMDPHGWGGFRRQSRARRRLRSARGVALMPRHCWWRRRRAPMLRSLG